MRLGEDYLQCLVGEMGVEWQNRGMAWAGRELRNHLGASCYPGLCNGLPSLDLNTSRGRESTGS